MQSSKLDGFEANLMVIVPPYFGVSGLTVVVVGAVVVGAVDVVAVVSVLVSFEVPQEVRKMPIIRRKATNRYTYFFT